MTWLAAKGAFGLFRWAWLLIAVAGILALAAAISGFIEHTLDSATEAGREAGTAAAVNAGQTTTLEQIGEANAAGNEVRNDRGSARYDQCLQSAAPGYERNCERYRPVEPVSGGPSAGDPPRP